MKNLLLITLLVVTQNILIAASDPLLDSAEAHYNANQYSKAINEYSTVLNKGYTSAHVHFNLGNSYYRNNEIGLAILNFEKALKLAPTDEDILHNLQLAHAAKVDQFEIIPEVSWDKLLLKVNQLFPANVLAIMSVLLVIGGAVLYMMRLKTKQNKFSTYTTISVLTGLALALFSIQMNNALESSKAGIILENNVQVLSAPNNKSTILLQVNEGTKLDIIGYSNEWIEIKTPANDKGWILKSTLSEI